MLETEFDMEFIELKKEGGDSNPASPKKAKIKLEEDC